MRHYKLPLLGALIALATLNAGCASKTAIETDPTDSFALRIAKAAGITMLKDVPAQDAGAMKNLISPGAGGIIDAGFIAGQVIAPPPGFSSLGGGVMGLFSALAFHKPKLGTGSAIILWMPKSEAPDEDSARKKIATIVAKAADDSFKAEYFKNFAISGEGSRTVSACVAFSGCFEWDAFRFTLDGGHCADAKGGRCTVTVDGGAYPRDTVGPDFLGGGPVWRSGASLGPTVVEDDLVRTRHAAADELSYYTEISKRLPAWAFVYIAPMNAARPDGKGGYEYFPYPLMLHQGKIHYFIAGAD